MTDDIPLEEPNPPIPFFQGPGRFIRTVIDERYLINNLVRRDLKSRYTRASIGFGWIFLEPLLLSGVYYILFTMIADRPEPNYALHVIIGVIVWSHFGKSLQATISCMTRGGNLVKQVYFPREILAISPVLTVMDFYHFTNSCHPCHVVFGSHAGKHDLDVTCFVDSCDLYGTRFGADFCSIECDIARCYPFV